MLATLSPLLLVAFLPFAVPLAVVGERLVPLMGDVASLFSLVRLDGFGSCVEWPVLAVEHGIDLRECPFIEGQFHEVEQSPGAGAAAPVEEDSEQLGFAVGGGLGAGRAGCNRLRLFHDFWLGLSPTYDCGFSLLL